MRFFHKQPKQVGVLRLEKKHPLAIRWFHWINFPVLAVMIWSGLLIYWANAAYNIGPFTFQRGHDTYYFLLKEPIHLFPDWLYHPGPYHWWFQHPTAKQTAGKLPVYELSGRLAEGMSWHFMLMWFFCINGVAYVLYTAFSGEWKHILPRKGTLKEAIHVVLHDLHLSKKPLPKEKFNGAQKIAYTGVIVMGLGSLVTGIAIYKPVQASFFTQLLGGYTVCRFLHFWLMILFILFFLVHVGQVVRTGWNNFRSMITGYEIVEEPTQ